MPESAVGGGRRAGASVARVARRIILDCDPGHDDAVALLLAHGSPDVELAAVTTVAGNHTLANVTRNARAVMTVAGITGVPVAAGADRPLVRPQVIADDIHGASGLDGPVLPTPSVPLDPRHAVDLIVELVMASEPGEITLVPVGPLTNIALAVRREPAIVERVAEVVLMGGGWSRGNTTPAAEFNVFVDPEAAHVVFDAPWAVTMVPLELTHQATATPDVLARIAAVGTAPARLAVELLEFFSSTYLAVEGMPAPPVHDPCAVARVIDPSVVAVRPAHVAVELAGTHTAGATVTDFRSPTRSGAPHNAAVATELDRDRFWGLVVGALEAIGEPAG